MDIWRDILVYMDIYLEFTDIRLSQNATLIFL